MSKMTDRVVFEAHLVTTNQGLERSGKNLLDLIHSEVQSSLC